MENLFYSPEDVDEVMFIPNIFLVEKSHPIKDLSNQISIVYDQLYFNEKTKAKWEYFIHHPSYYPDLYYKIRQAYLESKRNNMQVDFNYSTQHMSIIQINGQLKLFKYGKMISDIVKAEHISSRQVTGLNVKTLTISKKMRQGFRFPDYNGTRFSKDSKDIMFKNEKELFDEINRIELKQYVEKIFNANFMHNKINTLYQQLKIHGLKSVYEHPEFKYIFIKEDRSKKIQEIFSDENS